MVNVYFSFISNYYFVTSYLTEPKNGLQIVYYAPAPVIAQAAMLPNCAGVSVQFSSATTATSGMSSFEDYFYSGGPGANLNSTMAAWFGPGSACTMVWQSPSYAVLYANGLYQRSVSNTPGYVPLGPGATLEFRTNIIAALGYSYSDYVAGTVTIVPVPYPNTPPTPLIAVQAPTNVGPCHSFTLSIQGSVNMGGRDPISVKYTLNTGLLAQTALSLSAGHLSALLVNLNTILTAASLSNALEFTIPQKLLIAGATYSFDITTTSLSRRPFSMAVQRQRHPHSTRLGQSWISPTVPVSLTTSTSRRAWCSLRRTRLSLATRIGSR
jgi:hypothetical protein